MGPLIEIIFFAVLSAYIFFKLWSVLGQETEEDVERREKKRKAFEAMLEDNVIPLPQRQPRENTVNVEENDLKSGVREGLKSLCAKDPDFSFDKFMSGAKGAYEMILQAFSSGDHETLKLLLTPKVYNTFAKEIDDRNRRGETYEVQIERFDKLDVDAIEIHGDEALIAVRYRTRQVMVTRNAAGDIIENQAQISIPITDVWTFTRQIGSSEPNWYLSKTQSA